MTIPTFFNLFLIVSALIGFGFCLILFFSKYGREKSMRYLNLVILTISLNNFQSWLLSKDFYLSEYTLNYLQIPWHILTLPFFYMFLVYYLNIQEKAFNFLKIAYPIFVIEIIAQICFVVYNNNENTSQAHLRFLYERYTSVEEIISLVSSFGIFILSYYILRKKEDKFVSVLEFDNLQWIHTFFRLLTFGYCLWFIALSMKFVLNFKGFIVSYYPLRIFTTILIFWLGYQGIRQLRIIKERKLLRKVTQAKISTEKVEQKFEEHFTQIDDFIRSNKKFLEPKYTLQSLSSDTKLSVSTLSAVINNGANKSFVDYINEMRVEQAKKLLLAPEYKDYIIVSIGLECGFNSKSTFYNAFKKHTNYTPLAYKQQKKQAFL